ncbi:MAG TPA: glycosyltransferase family 2 protein, partial [Acidimicrobiia bacterium]|nr:glycosyltransferase family 2 protein [Acidimicrobiia bacterium]
MIALVIQVIGYAAVTYYALMNLYILGLSIHSALVLRRNHHLQRFGRVREMLSSRLAPPVSIVLPAYNEAAGIVDAIRSMSIVEYPRFEIVVANDGSSDDTLQALVEAFQLELVRIPYRDELSTRPIRAIYRGRSGVDITVVDKENGGRADALNAGINAARYPYVLCTDADVVLDAHCLVRAMQRVVEDRERTIGVGGNIRPLNGSTVELGHLISTSVPRSMVARMQILEYLRTFICSRPGWSEWNGLPNVSGAFGIWRRSAVMTVGGFSHGHMGEDMDLTLRMHKFHIDNDIPYRIVYEPSAVIWTEVPDTTRVLRRQRIRWHRGLMQIVSDFKSMLLNPRYGRVGMVTWPGYFLFEYLAPIIEFIGYVVVPTGIALNLLSTRAIIAMIAIAFGIGMLNSFIAILLDEPYGYANSGTDTARLVVIALAENFG